MFLKRQRRIQERQQEMLDLPIVTLQVYMMNNYQWDITIPTVILSRIRKLFQMNAQQELYPMSIQILIISITLKPQIICYLHSVKWKNIPNLGNTINAETDQTINNVFSKMLMNLRKIMAVFFNEPPMFFLIIR